MDKEHEYYLKLYEDAYRNRINDSKYNCVKKYLHKIVKHYYIKIKNVYHEPELNSFKPILKCFDKLIQEDNFNNIENNIDFLFLVNKYSVHFGEQLYTLMSPEKVYKDNQNHYYSKMYDCFFNYEFIYRDNECNKKTNTRIQDILDIYMKYIRNDRSIFSSKELNNIAVRLGSLFYLTNRDINELDELYNYLFNNFEIIKNSFTLNSDEVDTNYYNGIVNFVLNYKIDKPKKLIK